MRVHCSRGLTLDNGRAMRCRICGTSRLVAKAVGVCGGCLHRHYPQAEPHVEAAHARSRALFSLPLAPPKDEDGTPCAICLHACRIPEGGVGYCGLPPGDRLHAVVSWYHDPLPTNCVAGFACPGGTGCGFPRYAYRPGPERGYANLAVFYEACSFDCLYCQNWHFRLETRSGKAVSPEELAQAVDGRTACLCFFGGDPTPQLPHALEAARLAQEASRGRILRICWETNGCMNPALLEQMLELSLISGGCLKFDLKAWSEGVHRALTGASNRRTLENFARAAARISERPEVPLLVASTLLVPGYVDEDEVSGLARFIGDLDPSIPYSLLAFHPHCLMDDLPITSWAHMERCLAAAQGIGLTRVHIGNRHLLQPGDYSEGPPRP